MTKLPRHVIEDTHELPLDDYELDLTNSAKNEESKVSNKTGVTFVKLDKPSGGSLPDSVDSEAIIGMENGITVWQSVQLGTMKPAVLSLLSASHKDNESIVDENHKLFNDELGNLLSEDNSVFIQEGEDQEPTEFLGDINDIVDKIFGEKDKDKIKNGEGKSNDPFKITWNEDAIVNEEEHVREEKSIKSNYDQNKVTITENDNQTIKTVTGSKTGNQEDSTIPSKTKSIIVKNLPVYTDPVRVIEYKPINLKPVKVTKGRYPSVKQLPAARNYPSSQHRYQHNSPHSFKLPPIFYGGWQPIG